RASFFFFPATATAVVYPLSLHDALPIWARSRCPLDAGGLGADGRAHRGGCGAVSRPVPSRGHRGSHRRAARGAVRAGGGDRPRRDRKSTRLNSSHVKISYAVFCLKKKKK